MNVEGMVELFQCPGCVIGGSTTCGKFKLKLCEEGGGFCESHVLGTMMTGAGHIALGLPKGFNRPGPDDSRQQTRNKMDIRLWTTGKAPRWDLLNVPVWALENEGFLFVRTYLPRINCTFLDVVEGGRLAQAPAAIDVGLFRAEID